MSVVQPEDLNSSLASLALLHLQFKAGKDYLDYLHGFVIEAIKRLDGQLIDAVAVQKMVESEFGLKIPTATFVIYLKRLVSRQVIAPIGSGVQFRPVNLPMTTVSTDRVTAHEQITKVKEELAKFALKQFSLKWSDTVCTNALADFLRRYCIDFLQFAESKSPLPESDSDKEKTAYVVAAFVANTAKKQTTLFESIKVLVQSHILANALMCPDLQKSTRGFKDVCFFADTRFLIKALDLESPFDTSNARALLAAIRSLKGFVYVFTETKNELRTVLKGIIRGMQHGEGRGPVYHELQRRGRGVADVIIAESNLDVNLSALSISGYPSPTYSEDNYKFQIDENEFRDEIENEIENISKSAIDHDIRVVRHIFALRKGKYASTIEDARYVFLTTNSALSRAAFYYEKKNRQGWICSVSLPVAQRLE